jgi:hypothetical protein
MKNLIIGIGLLIFINAEARQTKITLKDALERKKIRACAHSLGGYSGNCMEVFIENITKDTLLISIEAGRRLNSIDDKQQDILIVKQQDILLSGGQKTNVVVKGYCCQAGNGVPVRNASYGIGSTSDSNLVRLARFLNSHKLNSNDEQNAVWAISDKKQTALIGSGDSLSMILRRYVAKLKNEPVPWYTIESRNIVNEGMVFNSPLNLTGDLNYTLENTRYVTCYLYNVNSVPVCAIREGWLLPGSGQKYFVNLPVKTLAKGRYKIILKTDDLVLAEKEVEI